jgi:hypothetical protein
MTPYARKILLITAIMAIPLAAVFSGCSMMLLTDDYAHVAIADSHSLLLVVQNDLYPALRLSLEQYMQDARSENHRTFLEVWAGGTAADMRDMFIDYRKERDISGVLLVGDLPVCWYEMVAHGRYEQFPCDVYLMDLDAAWTDEDGDGIMDAHSPLTIDIFLSRVSGSVSGLRGYFDKLHAYRSGSIQVEERAYIFKDDDWADYERGSAFDLNRIYDQLTIHENPEVTHRSNYLSILTGGGASYVYQWMHAYPSALCIENGTSYEYLYVSDIADRNPKALFYNLFNCSAARFTETNLAMSYLLETDFCLATMGSTKIGGNYFPAPFHSVLSRGGTWGEAYRVWYNSFGNTDDAWFLGMVVLGDPLLKITTEARQGLDSLSISPVPPDEEEADRLFLHMLEFEGDYGAEGYETYRSNHPAYY